MKKLPFKSYDPLVVPAIGTVQEHDSVYVCQVFLRLAFPLWHYQNAHIKQKQDPELYYSHNADINPGLTSSQLDDITELSAFPVFWRTVLEHLPGYGYCPKILLDRNNSMISSWSF